MSASVLYLDRNQYWFQPQSGQPTQAVQASWDGVHLAEVLTELKKKFKFASLNVLLGADISYVTAIKMDQPTRAEVLKAAAAVIPEDLDDHNFDWQRRGDQLQVIATSPFLLQALAFAGQQTQTKFLSVVPLSTLLARCLSNQAQATLILWEGPCPQMVIAYQGLSYFSRPPGLLNSQKILELLIFSQEKLKLPIQQTIYNLPKEKLPELPPEVTSTALSLNPLALLGEITANGSDEEVLNLNPAPAAAGRVSLGSPVIWIWLVGVLLIFVVALVFLVILKI